jgi:hypothetical protein
MSDEPAQNSKSAQKPAPTQAGRGFYSGANPIPTAHEFIEKFDIGKKQRDEELEKRQQQPQQPETTDAAPQAQAPAEPLKAGKGQKIVTDPVTGSEVVIENATKGGFRDADNPKVRFKSQIPKLVQLLTLSQARRSQCQSGERNCKDMISHQTQDSAHISSRLSRQTPHNLVKSTGVIKISLRLQTPLLREARPMCLFMGRKQISYSTPHLP